MRHVLCWFGGSGTIVSLYLSRTVEVEQVVGVEVWKELGFGRRNESWRKL